MPTCKIVADSSCDMTAFSGVDFAAAPLRIITAEKEYTDDQNLDTFAMVNHLLHYKGKSSTACPGPGDWLEAFGDAERIFCITITATLSGSYNAACTAKEIYEERHPDRKVFVFNSLTTGPEMKLVMELVRDRMAAGVDFDAICAEAVAYSQRTGLLFMLESIRNLANNGRVSPLAARAAGILGIRAVGCASDQGDLEMLDKSRGRDKALRALVANLRKLGYRGGKLRIAHAFNPEAVERLVEYLREEFGPVEPEVYPCGGLCSFYAEMGGILIGFEKE